MFPCLRAGCKGLVLFKVKSERNEPMHGYCPVCLVVYEIEIKEVGMIAKGKGALLPQPEKDV